MSARGRSTSGDPHRLSETLSALSAKIGLASTAVFTAVFGCWAEIVGDAVAQHVKPLRLDGPTLVVGVDHPAWATQVRNLAPEILEQIRKRCGDNDTVPERLEVRVLR